MIPHFMAHPVRYCRANISFDKLSTCALILASIRGILYLRDNRCSYDCDGAYKHRMASIGFLMIIGDALNAVIYKINYPAEPLFDPDREPMPKNSHPVYQIVETICADSVTCLTSSLYVSHGVSTSARYQYVSLKIVREVDWFFKNVFRRKCRFWGTPFNELILSLNMASFGLIYDNNYSIIAAAPYQLLTILFENRSINYYSMLEKRTCHNIFMTFYVVFITRAINAR